MPNTQQTEMNSQMDDAIMEYGLSSAPNIIDLSSGDNVFYGKIDRMYNTIMIKNFAHLFTNIGNGALVLDFVADAFAALRTHILSVKARAGTYLHPTYKDPHTGVEIESTVLKIEPHSGLIDPFALFRENMDVIFDLFLKTYLKEKNRYRSIHDHKDFVKHLIKFALSERMLPHLKFSQSAFIKISGCPKEISGLIIKIADDDANDVSDINSKYLQDPNFDFFARAAGKFGFLIDAKRPWVLIANLNSAGMKKFMNARKVFYKQIIPGAINLDDPNIMTPEQDYDRVFNICMNMWLAGQYFLSEDLAAMMNVGAVTESIKSDDPAGDWRTFDFWLPLGNELAMAAATQVAKEAALNKKQKIDTAFEVSKNSYHDVFSRYYQKTFLTDVHILKAEILNMYNTFASINSFYDIPGTEKTNEGLKTVHRAVYRSKITQELFEKDFPFGFWLRFYLDIRINEERIFIKKQKYNSIIKKVIKIYSNTGQNGAIEYLNQEIQRRATFAISGPAPPYIDYTAGQSHFQKLSQYFS